MSSLTRRQTEIVQQLADGASHKEIARAQYVSKILGEARKRLGLRTNIQLIAESLRRGLIK